MNLSFYAWFPYQGLFSLYLLEVRLKTKNFEPVFCFLKALFGRFFGSIMVSRAWQLDNTWLLSTIICGTCFADFAGETN